MLELGSGLGICGLAAGFCGAHVTLTDTSDVLPGLDTNIAANNQVMSGGGAGGWCDCACLYACMRAWT